MRSIAPITVTLLAGGLLLSGCKSEPRKATAEVQPVQVMSLAQAVRSETWSYTGTVRPRFEADVSFRVAGKIVRRLVDIGQSVSAGQALAELDPTDYRLAVEAQAAELEAARSNRSQAVAAEGRYRALYAQGHVAKAALEARTSAADEARSRESRAERALTLAQNQLAYTVLKADADGVVSSLPAETGQVVAAGQAVAKVARLGEIEAQVAIPEHRLAEVKAAEAAIDFWGANGARIAASLREISPEADRASRTYQARFAFAAEPKPELGRTVTVHLSRASGERAYSVPISAVMQDGARPSVWVVEAGGERVRKVAVSLEGLSKQTAIIRGDLTSADRIVALGVHMLDAAKPVRIVEVRAVLQ